MSIVYQLGKYQIVKTTIQYAPPPPSPPSPQKKKKKENLFHEMGWQYNNAGWRVVGVYNKMSSVMPFSVML